MIKNKTLTIIVSSTLLIASAIFAYFIVGTSIFEYKINFLSVSIVYPLSLFLSSLILFIFSLNSFKKNLKIGALLIVLSLTLFFYTNVKAVLFYANGNDGGWLGFLFMFLVCLDLFLIGLRFYKSK